MEVAVTRQASLISQRCHELVTQVVLGIQRIVVDARGGQSAGEDLNTDGASCWQSIRAKTRNRVRVRRIAGKIARIRRKGIRNATIRQRLRASRDGRPGLAQVRRYRQAGILEDIGRDGDLFSVIAKAVTAANHQAAVELMAEQRSRTPGNTNLGSEIVLLRVPGISSLNGQASQEIRPCARDGRKHVALLGGEWTKIGPAQAHAESQIAADFEVILDEQAPDILAVVLAKRCRDSSNRIEVPLLPLWRIIEKCPDIEEVITWNSVTIARIILQIKWACAFAAKLNAVASVN